VITGFPSRRAFLAGSLALPALAAPDQKVIDVATHFYDTARPQGVPWPSPKEPVLYKPTFPDRYLSAIRPYAVHGVVAIEASPWLEDNLWLLTLADRSPLIRAVVGNIAPGHPDFRAALERFSKHPLWRGIRINAANIARSPEDMKLLMEKDLSLDVLVGQPVYEEIARLAEAFPELRIIVGHLPLDDSTGIRTCAAHRNVYAKVSGVVRKTNGNYKPRLDELWDVFGPDRVLFASNWPTCDMIAPYPVVFKVVADYLADKPAEVREKFFWKNATTAYRLLA
jgi:predicted TIM-barrel fold metal-dependent hydrolase